MINVDTRFISRGNNVIKKLYEETNEKNQSLHIEKILGGAIYPSKTENAIAYSSENDALYMNVTAVYIGCFLYAWGHAITNNLARLWAIEKIIRENENVFFAYSTVNLNDDIPPYFMEILQKFSVIPEKMIKITKLTKFKELLIPDESFFCNEGDNSKAFTKEYITSINRIIDSYQYSSTYKKFDKIYFSREKIHDGKDTGEKRIRPIFEKMGYHVVFPEEHTLEEQIYMLQHCNSFASTEGSCAHNAIFLQEGANVILLRKANYCNTFQVAINIARKLKVTYIDVNMSNILPHDVRICWGPFFLYQTRELASYAGIKKEPFPLKDYFRYVFKYYKTCPFVVELRCFFGKIRRNISENR